MRKTMFVLMLICLLAFLLLLWQGWLYLAACSDPEFDTDRYIAEYTGVEPLDYSDRSVSDTHGGFHGDGEMLAVYRFEVEAGARFCETVAQTVHWQELPLADKAAHFMSRYSELNIAVDEIREGYWFILDEQEEGEARFRSDEIFSGCSTNAKCAVFDAERNILYFKEVDT